MAFKYRPLARRVSLTALPTPPLSTRSSGSALNMSWSRSRATTHDPRNSRGDALVVRPQLKLIGDEGGSALRGTGDRAAGRGKGRAHSAGHVLRLPDPRPA